jgi:hypothetical protein
VVAAITPWNYPLYTTLAKIGPDPAAGNTTLGGNLNIPGIFSIALIPTFGHSA